MWYRLVILFLLAGSCSLPGYSQKRGGGGRTKDGRETFNSRKQKNTSYGSQRRDSFTYKSSRSKSKRSNDPFAYRSKQKGKDKNKSVPFAYKSKSQKKSKQRNDNLFGSKQGKSNARKGGSNKDSFVGGRNNSSRIKRKQEQRGVGDFGISRKKADKLRQKSRTKEENGKIWEQELRRKPNS